ncbi:Atg16p [Rhodotorula paludigena]|uniref:Atg16p n=1 Tax=Rhodotorula paludigena TaxID=86838 RepID=UPI003180C2F3
MAWDEQIRVQLLARDAREQSHAALIAHVHRLAQLSVHLRDRNAALLAAAAQSSRAAAPGGAPAGDSKDAALRAALVASLEAQLAQTRADLSEQYKVQSANAQRLLALTDSLRDAEERARDEREELRRLRSEVERLRERARWHKEIVAEKEKQLVILQDEHASLELELSQLEIQNDNLKTDNAALLQRWLESKAEEANRMNEANAFLEEAKRLRGESEGAKGKDKEASEGVDAGADA